MSVSKKYGFDGSRCEWGKQLARDGYSPYTRPVIKLESKKDRSCCNRLIRNYTQGLEPTEQPSLQKKRKTMHVHDKHKAKLNTS